MLIREDHGPVLLLRMEHGKANALDLELLSAIRRELEAEEKGGSPRAVVLTGSGKVFSAGMDLLQFVDRGGSYIELALQELSATVLGMLTYSRPVVATLNGHAIAGGWVLACSCDYRLMSRGGGRIGLAELAVGVVFPSAPLEVVRAATPRGFLPRMIFTGCQLEFEEAHRRGLVHETVEPGELLERALAAAGEMARIPESVFALTKRQLREPVLQRIAEGVDKFEHQVVERWLSEDARQGIVAYVESNLKRGGAGRKEEEPGD